jgi:hypothetical protein
MSVEEGTTFRHISREQKRAAIELFKAGVSRKKIWTQLNMSDRSLRKILSYAKNNPDSPIGTRKLGSGRPTVFTPEVKKKMRNMLRKNPGLSGAQLKGRSVVEPDPKLVAGSGQPRIRNEFGEKNLFDTIHNFSAKC